MSDLRNAIAQALTNSANYPRQVQPHILGRDMSGLINAVTAAVEAVQDRPLDPKPWVDREDVDEIRQAYPDAWTEFEPRPGYEQDRSKYA